MLLHPSATMDVRILCQTSVGEGCGDGCGEGCDLFGESGSGIEIGGWTQFGYQDGPDGVFTVTVRSTM